MATRQDRYPGVCQQLRSGGYCVGKHGPWMMQNCPESCQSATLPPTVVVGATPPPPPAPKAPPHLLVHFGDILTLRTSGVSAPTYAWLQPLLNAYRSHAIEFRYVSSISLSATSAGFRTDLGLEMHASTDGYQLNATLTNGLAFAGAIYIYKNRWVRMIVRSYDSNTRVQKTLDSYLATAACPAGLTTAACSDTLFTPRTSQEWRDGNGAITSMMVRPVTPAPAPTPQRTPAPTARAVATHHMMVDFDAGRTQRPPSGYEWLGPLIRMLSGTLAPFRHEQRLVDYGSPQPPNMPTTGPIGGYRLQYYVVNFFYDGSTIYFVYLGVIYIDTNGRIRMVVRAYHPEETKMEKPLQTLDATLQECTLSIDRCIPDGTSQLPQRPQTWIESRSPNAVLPFIRVHGLTRT